VADQLEKQIEAVANQDGRVWQAPVRPDVPAFVPLAERTTPVISILNLKGGVGKTTLAANIAGYLSKHEGKRVLLIDLDHQRSLSQLLLSPKERDSAADAGHTIQGFLRATPQDGAGLFACARSIPGLENCKIVTNADPRNGAKGESLDDLEMHLLSKWLVVPRSFDVRFLLRAALQSKTIQAHFDYVLLDCPPRLTTACISALSGSDYLLMPTQAEAVSLASVYHLINRLMPLRAGGVVPDLKVLGFVANMVGPKGTTDDSHQQRLLNKTAVAVSQVWGRTIPCYETLLRRHENYAEATRFLDADEGLRLAIYYKGVRDDVSSLVNEIRSTVDADCGRPPAVPA
jgi:cellulose biosynthesis protein BcsQ